MKKLVNSLPTKITAFMLSLVTVIIFVFSTFTIILMANYQFYFSDKKIVKSEILTDMAYNESNYISSRISYSNVSLEDYYADKNVFYQICSVDGEVLQSNYKGEKYIATATTEHFGHAEEFEIDYNYNDSEYVIYNEIHTADITVYIAEDMKHNDIFSLVSKIIDIGFIMKYFMILIAFLSFSASIALISFLFFAAGHNFDGEVKLNYFDKIPFDICLFLVIIAAMVSLICVKVFSYNQIASIMVLFLMACVDYCIGLSLLLSIATRIKTGTLFKNTIIYRILHGIKNTFKVPMVYARYTFSNLSLIKKTVSFVAFFAVFDIIFIFYEYILFLNHNSFLFTISLIIISLIIFSFIIYLGLVLQKIKNGGEEISNGNLEHKIDTEYMFGDFKEFSENINNINSSLQIAVDEKMKSERFKVELITNVSHDIKTPLTSIINYVDLIKKEEIDNVTVKEYVDVLDRQSGRLKKLVEDLVEASKASSGNLPVELVPCNVGVLLSQAIGEFEEKLSNVNITPVLKLPSDNITVLADGRHLWRVFDNLLSNVCKYAMLGTRLYITVHDNDERTEIVFRNISKYELNITADELMERFVRGDKSRNTDGHGLGLSIARSLLELQGGKLKLEVDGDLFKATVVFNK